MYIADIVLKFIIFILQKIILPIFPNEVADFSVVQWNTFLQGTLRHNFAWALSGMNAFFNIQLIFILILVIFTAEICYWGVRAGIFIINLIRGSGA